MIDFPEWVLQDLITFYNITLSYLVGAQLIRKKQFISNNQCLDTCNINHKQTKSVIERTHSQNVMHFPIL